MAKIFLSYSRSDLKRITPLAKALEDEGHSVWWDRRIKGGSEFDAVIEKALADAERVVVAWSETASRSAWVRDEAAVGRDRHCLVPLTLDGSLPPLGFRQFQTIDLSRWRGRGHPPQLDELIEALAAPTPDARPQRPSVEPGRRRQWLTFPRLPVIAAAAAILAAVIGGGWWWVVRGPADTPAVAIEAGNASEESQAVARDVAAQLGALQPAGGGAFQVISNQGDADLVLQITASHNGETLHRDLRLLSGHSILWSTTVEVDTPNSDDLQQELPRISKQILSCAFDARRDRVDPPTLKLYLRGCSQLEDRMALINYDTPAEKLFEAVVRKAPNFEGGWAKLLLATEAAGQIDDLKARIARVEKLGFNPGELYAAKARLLPAQDFLGKLSLIDAGITEDPDSAILYERRAAYLARVGRTKDALSDAARALQLDPLSLDSQNSYIRLLAEGGRIAQAHLELNRRAAKWPKALVIRVNDYDFYKRFGDPKQALAMYRDGVFTLPSQEDEDWILARIDPTPEKIQRAIDSVRARFARDPGYAVGLVQVLGQFGQSDEAIDLMLHYTGPETILYTANLFRPAMRNVWRDPRSMAAAAHLGFLRYWKASGRWPDFCAEADLPYDCKQEASKLDANAFLALSSALPDPSDLPLPPTSTAKCRDGNFSSSQSKRGTCALHGGVAKWLSTGKPS